LQREDKRGLTPTHWAKKHNKQQMLDLLLQNGGVPLGSKQKKVVRKPEAEEK